MVHRMRIIGALFGLAVATPTLAEHADKDKPTVILADRDDGDLASQVSVFAGNVSLTKGTILMRADQLVVQQDPDRYTVGTGTARPGRLVTFRQKRDGVDERLDGAADKVVYDERTDTTRLFDRAVVRWVREGRDANEVRGDRIVYDGRTERFSAESAATAGRRTQTRAILQPRLRTVVNDGPLSLTTQPRLAAQPD